VPKASRHGAAATACSCMLVRHATEIKRYINYSPFESTDGPPTRQVDFLLAAVFTGNSRHVVGAQFRHSMLVLWALGRLWGCGALRTDYTARSLSTLPVRHRQTSSVSMVVQQASASSHFSAPYGHGAVHG
jgi:hypothetical protein